MNDTVDDGSLVGGLLPIRVEDSGNLQFDAAVTALSNTQNLAA